MINKTFKKIPKKISVMGQTYQNKQRKDVVLDGQECEGVADVANKIIYIKKTLDPKTKWAVFFHEALHAVIFESAAWQNIDDSTEQIIVEKMSQFVVQILDSHF